MTSGWNDLSPEFRDDARRYKYVGTLELVPPEWDGLGYPRSNAMSGDIRFDINLEYGYSPEFYEERIEELVRLFDAHPMWGLSIVRTVPYEHLLRSDIPVYVEPEPDPEPEPEEPGEPGEPAPPEDPSGNVPTEPGLPGSGNDDDDDTPTPGPGPTPTPTPGGGDGTPVEDEGTTDEPDSDLPIGVTP